jgi:hypothetical protein
MFSQIDKQQPRYQGQHSLRQLKSIKANLCIALPCSLRQKKHRSRTKLETSHDEGEVVASIVRLHRSRRTTELGSISRSEWCRRPLWKFEEASPLLLLLLPLHDIPGLLPLLLCCCVQVVDEVDAIRVDWQLTTSAVSSPVALSYSLIANLLVVVLLLMPFYTYLSVAPFRTLLSTSS